MLCHIANLMPYRIADVLQQMPQTATVKGGNPYPKQARKISLSQLLVFLRQYVLAMILFWDL